MRAILYVDEYYILAENVYKAIVKTLKEIKATKLLCTCDNKVRNILHNLSIELKLKYKVFYFEYDMYNKVAFKMMNNEIVQNCDCCIYIGNDRTPSHVLDVLKNNNKTIIKITI